METVSSKKDVYKHGLAVYAQPFFYGAITRLPFIYFVIHMRFQFDLGWNWIGIYVGAYQATRVVTSLTSLVCPRIAHSVGTCIALAGSVLVIASDSNNQTNIILGTVVVGFGETLAAMQTYVKGQFGSDLASLEHNLKVQYAAVMVGVTVAFSIGGIVYQQFGMNGVAVFGAVMAIGELISLAAYIVLDAQDEVGLLEENRDDTSHNSMSRHSSDEEEDTNDEESNKSDKKQSAHVDQKENHTKDNEAKNSEDNTILKSALNSFSDSGMGANYLSYVLCFTFGMEAVTIGYNLAVSPVYITEVFEQNTTVIGVLLAAGAAFGTLTSILISLSPKGKAVMESWLPSPWNILVALSGISASVLIAAVPVFPIHVVGLLFLMGTNDLAALLLNEMQGTITSTKAYATIGPMGQVIRRSGNVITAITGPILYGILPQLPYIVAGSVTALWTIVLALVIRHRTNDRVNIVKNSEPTVSELFDSTTFTQKEIIARQVKKGQI